MCSTEQILRALPKYTRQEVRYALTKSVNRNIIQNVGARRKALWLLGKSLQIAPAKPAPICNGTSTQPYKPEQSLPARPGAMDAFRVASKG
jgi:hypothetical protein